MSGFVSRHVVRDVGLPEYREKIMALIEKDLLNDDNVLAFFYGGSIANETMDQFSDIDLRVVVRSEKIEEYIANKNNRPSEWGNVLYIEDVNPYSIYTVIHYDSFIKVDTFYYKLEDIQPSVWLKNIKIRKDNKERLAEILNKSMELSYEPSFDEFELWRSKFFAHLHEAYRRAMREEYYYAINCIDKLRLSIAGAWYMDAGHQPNALGDWAKYEGGRSELDSWQQSLLASWECGRSSVEIINVMKSIVHEFRNVHSSLCERLEVDEKPEWVYKIVNMVL
ncbi:aminoglycoside 6-adenylyltransferase [Virgibacillus sp. JSM 102003]|uniref:aminoglycoside 6-adenylyltransferase n=1 Tax=Virgibacillus sp. JSM 102003 TaxID=1562108 RepID=UPI0035C26043